MRLAAFAPSLPRSSPADEHQSDARLACRAQPLGGGDLRGENALRIARAAAIEHAVLDAARKERRHAVEVRREHDLRLADRGDDVDPRLSGSGIGDRVGQGIQRLLEDRIARLAKEIREPCSRPLLHSRSSIRCRSAVARADDAIGSTGSTVRAPCARRSCRRDTSRSPAWRATGPTPCRRRPSRRARPAPPRRPAESPAAGRPPA